MPLSIFFALAADRRVRISKARIISESCAATRMHRRLGKPSVTSLLALQSMNRLPLAAVHGLKDLSFVAINLHGRRASFGTTHRDSSVESVGEFWLWELSKN